MSIKRLNDLKRQIRNSQTKAVHIEFIVGICNSKSRIANEYNSQRVSKELHIRRIVKAEQNIASVYNVSLKQGSTSTRNPRKRHCIKPGQEDKIHQNNHRCFSARRRQEF